MASTTFTDKVTVIPTEWLNDVNGTVWTLFGGVTTASAARTALGLGTMATQAASSVAITGGTITGLSSALPVASGGTGTTTSTGSGNVVLATSPTITTPTITTPTVTGPLSLTSTTGTNFVSFVSSLASTETALFVDNTQTTSGSSIKISNSGNNKQITLRLSSTGGADLYVNQASGGSSTSGTNGMNISSAGNVNFLGTVSENSKRVFSRTSMASITKQTYTAANTKYTFAHGLSGIPVNVEVYVKCLGTSNTAGNDFPTGHVIYIVNTQSTSTVTISADATNVYVSVAGNIAVSDWTTPSSIVALSTSSKWDIYVNAWY